MIRRWENIDVCGTPIGSQVLAPAQHYGAFSEIRRLEYLVYGGGGKNGLRCLRVYQARVVRSQTALGAGFGVRGDYRIYLDIEVRRIDCRQCMKVKQEKLEWLAGNPFYSKRFAFFVGRRCPAMTIQEDAQETHPDWKTGKEVDQQYMHEQARQIRRSNPQVN